jgi:hypothetical protein
VYQLSDQLSGRMAIDEQNGALRDDNDLNGGCKVGLIG